MTTPNNPGAVVGVGRSRVRGDPLGRMGIHDRNSDANPRVAPSLGPGIPGTLRQGPSLLAQTRGAALSQTISPWTGSNFGGNNPTVRPEANSEIRVTRVIDHATLQVGDTEQGQLVFIKRHSGMVERNIQTHNHVLSLGRFNHYLKYGAGRYKYGRSKNAAPIVDDWSFDGRQQTKMPPSDSPNFRDSIAIVNFMSGYVQVSDVWAVNRSRKRGRDLDGIVELDYGFLILRRYREENPYTVAQKGKDWDKEQEKAWDANTSAQYYWRVDPVSFRNQTPDPALWMNENPDTPEDNYIGYPWYVCRVMARVKRICSNSNWASLAVGAVYPTEINGDYISSHGQLPLLEVHMMP